MIILNKFIRINKIYGNHVEFKNITFVTAKAIYIYQVKTKKKRYCMYDSFHRYQTSYPLATLVVLYSYYIDISIFNLDNLIGIKHRTYGVKMLYVANDDLFNILVNLTDLYSKYKDIICVP